MVTVSRDGKLAGHSELERLEEVKKEGAPCCTKALLGSVQITEHHPHLPCLLSTEACAGAYMSPEAASSLPVHLHLHLGPGHHTAAVCSISTHFPWKHQLLLPTTVACGLSDANYDAVGLPSRT